MNNSCFFANRDLDLKDIKVIGYDMDYTLIHYHVNKWEEKAYEHTLNYLINEEGWPLKHLSFDPNITKRGLVLDLKKGNIVKVDEFGCVTMASHGLRTLSEEEVKKEYSSTFVDLSDPYYVFLNTLFSISTGCLYAQLVNELGKKNLETFLSYRSIFETISKAQNMAHLMGKLKEEISSDPDSFVDLDPKVPQALLDQKHAGKKIFLATNSDWLYTNNMMSYAMTPFLKGGKWEDLFDLIIVGADKPNFFGSSQRIYEVNTQENVLKPHFGKLKSHVYHGGCAPIVESTFNVQGREILYVGDHIYSDINIAKKSRRWYTALVLRELEQELSDLDSYQSERDFIFNETEKKNEFDKEISRLKLLKQKVITPYAETPKQSLPELEKEIETLELKIKTCNHEIESKTLHLKEKVNSPWGFLMRVGNSRSLIAKQIAKHADIYSARVSDFLEATPYRSFRSKPALFSHDFRGKAKNKRI